jgi:Mn2+/Fe2+ NRAMP family transporter
MTAKKLLNLVGPGMLVAATGVGAGDLATAAFAGGKLGTAVLWAVLAGALLKLVLNEGLARWQLATDATFLEGVASRLGRGPLWLFMPYFLLWSFFVGSALIAACGVTLHALIPVFADPAHAKITFGAAASAVGLILVLAGGYRVFARVMSGCILAMFVTVLATALLYWPGLAPVLSGLVPAPGRLNGDELSWTIGLMGGVGGTVTILCYGYWIREEGRRGLDDLRTCRIDLGAGYAMTALFGLAMVIIGSQVAVAGSGAGLIVALADALEARLGPIGRWAFLLGAFGAVFSSLLGVWQSVPYLFADLVGLLRAPDAPTARAVDTRAPPYRLYLVAMATVPMAGLATEFRQLQKWYAVVGASFMPIVAVGLLVLNRRKWLGAAANRAPTIALLVAAVGFFVWAGLR